MSERHLEERLGAALYRLSTLERRAAAVQDEPRLAVRLVDDVRKLATDLERAFADVREMAAECARLREAAVHAEGRARGLFERVPTPCVVLDLAGTILDANGPAVQLLNVSRRHLVGRSFQLYLGGDRDDFLLRLRGIATGEPAALSATLRPRERSAVSVDLTLTADGTDQVLLILQPTSAEAAFRLPSERPSPPAATA